MTVGMDINATVRGPFFDGRTKRAISMALQDTLQDVTERGESIVKRQLFPGHGMVTGTLKRSIAGEVVNSLRAFVSTNVVYGGWIEGTSRRNQTTRFKGYSMFRKARQALNRSWPRLLQRHLRRRMR